MAGQIGEGFASGYLGAGNELLAQQQSQIQQALEIAREHMLEAQTAHQQKMNDWMTSPDNPMNVHAAAQAAYWQEQADTQKQYRTDQQATAKKKEEDAAIQKLVDQGDRAFNVAGNSPQVAYAALKAKYPDVYEEKINSLIPQMQAERNAMPPGPAQPYTVPTLAGAQEPNSIQASPGPPPATAVPVHAPQGQAMPSTPEQSGASMMGGASAAMMNTPEGRAAFAPVGQGQPQGAAMPANDQTGGVSAGPTASLSVPFGQSQMTLPPAPPPTVTEADLHAYQSPQFREQQEKNRANAVLQKARADALLITAKAKEALEVPAKTRADAAMVAAQARRKDSDTREIELNKGLGPYYDHLKAIEDRIGVQNKLAEQLGVLRKVQGDYLNLKGKNDTTRANAYAKYGGPQALSALKAIESEWKDLNGDAEKLQKQADALDTEARKQLEDAAIFNKAAEGQPTDSAKSIMAIQEQRKAHGLVQQAVDAKTKAKLANDAAAAYKATADKARANLTDVGLLKFGDNAGPGPQSRLPSAPNAVDPAAWASQFKPKK